MFTVSYGRIAFPLVARILTTRGRVGIPIGEANPLAIRLAAELLQAELDASDTGDCVIVDPDNPNEPLDVIVTPR
jgi:hypothetical protein